MRQVTIFVMFGALLFILIITMTQKKKNEKNEMEVLGILLYLLLSQKDRDPNGILFYIEKLTRFNREFVNKLRMGYLKNQSYKVPIIKEKRASLFSTAIQTLYKNGSARAAEFLDNMNELARNDHLRMQKLANEIVNSVGIVFSIIAMFMVIIYFLSPYAQAIFSYT